MRRAAKVDRNHGEVVNALRKVGCSVQDLSAVGKGCPDLLVGVTCRAHDGVNLLLEVKDGAKPPSARKLTPDQEQWHGHWRGPVAIVTTVDEALDIVREIREGWT
jgi:hypothetical protein